MRAELLAYRDLASLLLSALWGKITRGESIKDRLTLEGLQNRRILAELEKCKPH